MRLAKVAIPVDHGCDRVSKLDQPARTYRLDMFAGYVKALNALSADNPKKAHQEADIILLEALDRAGGGEVADAWTRASKRIGFWGA